MKRIAFMLLVVCLFGVTARTQTRIYQKGTVTRMQMSQCAAASGGFLAALSGQQNMLSPGENCPEYVLVSDRVVYIIVSKSSHDLIPLAEDINFRLLKNEILVRLDDSPREVRMSVRAMALRDEWEREELERQRTKAAAHVAHGESLR